MSSQSAETDGQNETMESLKEENKRLREIERLYLIQKGLAPSRPTRLTIPADLATLADNARDLSPSLSPRGSYSDHLLEAEQIIHSTSKTNKTLNAVLESFIDFLRPNKRSESKRVSVLSFLKSLVRKSSGAQVYPHGSYALKTYLPDDEVDVSAFFSHAYESSWVQRVVNALCQEASSEQEGVTRPAAHFAVQKVTVIFSEEHTVVKCQIGSVRVNIYGNQVTALASSALFEYVDRQVFRQQHDTRRTKISLIHPIHLTHMFGNGW